MRLFPMNVAMTEPTAPEDWTIDVVNHPTATAFIGERFCIKNSLISGANANEVFLISSMDRMNR